MKYLYLVLSLFIASAAFAAPQSWKQIAQDALMHGDYAKATEYYRKWTEADPTDAVSFYNLACCYALSKHADDAMSALQKAAGAGWSDAEHTTQDPDLESLRARKEFQKITEVISNNEASREGGYIVQSCQQERIGNYVAVLPGEYDPNHKYPLVILLHGYAQSAQEFAQVTTLINTRDFIYVIPEGAYTALDSDGKGYSHLRELDNYREDTSSVALAADWILRVADDAIKHYPVSGDRVWLVGFSQGAALAHVVAARAPGRVWGYAAHGGYIIKGAITESQLGSEKKHNLHVLITHDKADPAVDFAEATYSVNMLRHSGIDVTFSETTGKHVFDAEVAEKVGEWLKANDKSEAGN